MLLLGNGRVITRDAERPCLEDGCVAMEGGFIREVGAASTLRDKYPGARFIDAHGGVIMPGLINAHNHIYSAFARGMSIKNAPTRNFLEILQNLWWTLDHHMLEEDTRLSAEATFIDCIENGVTTVFDHHASYGQVEGSLFAIAEAAQKYGLRACLCYEVSDREGPEKMRMAVKENLDFIRWASDQPGDALRGTMGLHAPFTLSNETLDYVASALPEGVGCHVHAAEGVDDVRICLREYGRRPVFRLYDFGLLGKKSICGHCTHVNEAEIDLLTQTDTCVAHNPESNMGNAIGCPPALRMLARGVTVALGTDGYTNDMLESYKVGNLLHKHSLCDPTAAWSEIPRMLFENNPALAARFFERPVGVLKPGAHADVIALDYVPLTPMDADNLNSHVMFGMNGRSVTTTIAGGKVLMEDRRLIGVDRQAVLARCREAADRLWRRINAGR